jgi:uncharacterized protein involved in cysteine biosynthesis
VLTAFARAFGQLGDPRVRRVLWISLAATIVVYGLLIAGMSWLMFGTNVLTGLPGWETALDIGGLLLAVVVALFLFPAVITAVLGFFLEEVADAVEARWYPGLPAPRSIGLGEALWTAGRFAVVAVGLNILVLPLFLVPVLGQVAFYVVNGYLVGREYFELVMLRRLDGEAVEALRKTNMVRLWMVGAATAFLLTIPFVNIVAPVVGTAAMVHVARRMAGKHLPTAV